MSKNIDHILHLLLEQRNLDFTGYRLPMLERRIQKRIYSTNCNSMDEYFTYFKSNHQEADHLIDALTINVSRFFRNSFFFEYISKVLIPELIQNNVKENRGLRIWSTGCAYGEEPYTMAIIINEFLEKENINIDLNIFATDIDKKALEQAGIGSYDISSINGVKYGILKKYFKQEGNQFLINSNIKSMVRFSYYDLLDKNSQTPPESIFGGFDIVLCRNVLIYFDKNYQEILFHKLYKSLNKNGYLVLGEAEIPSGVYKNMFRRENNLSKIYRKI